MYFLFENYEIIQQKVKNMDKAKVVFQKLAVLVLEVRKC